ncbi:MAG: hypothetical protein KH319_08530 [Butyricicoccus pullicaecorum]|nr:hypothetical protein [Butyricicoccus pullicaecorum]
MKQLITREYWIPKIVTFFGMFAGLCNVAASDWGYGARYTMFHTVVTLIYMMIAVGTALYCIHKRRKSSLVTAAIHWSAVILLTLPVIFEKFGLLTFNSTGYYTVMVLVPLNGALFGVNRFWGAKLGALANASFPVLFAAGMLALIGWGMHRMVR